MNRYINQLSSLMDDIFSKYRKQKNTKEKVGVLVSGGIDSSIVAHYCKKYFPKQTVLFSFGALNSKDRPYVDLLQKHLDLPLIWLSINQGLITTSFNIVKKLLETINLSNSLMHLSLAAGYFLICQTSAQAGIRDIFTGQGPDVIMAGYSKYKRLMIQEAENNELIKQAIIKDLDNLEIDKTRDNAIANYHNIQLYNPFIEQPFINLCLKIPVKYKLVSNNKSSTLSEGKQRGVFFSEKYIERLWGKSLGLPEEIVWRPKMAFQYSTQIQKLVEKFIYN